MLCNNLHVHVSEIKSMPIGSVKLTFGKMKTGADEWRQMKSMMTMTSHYSSF